MCREKKNKEKEKEKEQDKYAVQKLQENEGKKEQHFSPKRSDSSGGRGWYWPAKCTASSRKNFDQPRAEAEARSILRL